MDLTKVRSLIKMLDGTDVAEIEVTEGEQSVRITRVQGVVTTNITSPSVAAPIVYHAPTAAPEQHAPKEIKPDETIKGHAMKAPMVGTVYLSSSPDAEPFVRVGQRVEAGEIVCIVEAMKMFNQIEADVAGTITGRLVENGQPVEYGQTLFIIE
ncbi:MAG: acetyl-CoA carboxylase biotin carboxyl carrier protein [Gammaproteobacteria bacterium]|nr:acetyl-CoA carboxylase biotin carboxyl carrier protein [Gammaproteobacteria bacterium]